MAHPNTPMRRREILLARVLEEHRDDLLEFARRRVRDVATAEDVLGATVERAVSRIGELRDESAMLAWLYRTLRNAIVDHHRKMGVAGRATAQLAAEMETATPEPPGQACACVTEVANALKPEYAEALQRIEVQGQPVRSFAAEAGISRSNAAVRVFRAREALRRGVVATCGGCAETGCADCTCGTPPSDLP